jgi:hypothetical protein
MANENAEAAFLAETKRKAAALKKARTVKAGTSYLTRKQLLDAYKHKKDKDKWNETARVVGGSFGDGKKKDDKGKVKEDRGPYVSLSYTFVTGPLTGETVSSYFNLDAEKSKAQRWDFDAEEMVAADDEYLLEELCKALQRCGVETDDIDFAGIVEAVKELTKTKPAVKIALQKKKMNKPDKDGNKETINHSIAGSAVIQSDAPKNGATGEDTEEETPEEEDDATSEDPASEEGGFYENDIVGYKPPRSRAEVRCVVINVNLDSEGNPESYDLRNEDTDQEYKGVAEDKLTLIEAGAS